MTTKATTSSSRTKGQTKPKPPSSASRRASTPTTPRPRAPRKPRTPKVRETGQPGPHTTVLKGFTYNPPQGQPGHHANAQPGASWAKDSPAANVLIIIQAGGSMALAARAAGLHESTPRAWNSRGRDLLGEWTTLDDFAATAPDLETLALGAFHISAEAAGAAPVATALAAISNAQNTEWRAAAHMLKVLPQAGDYRETTKAEITGAGGGPVEFAVDDTTRQLLALADQFADDATKRKGTKP